MKKYTTLMTMLVLIPFHHNVSASEMEVNLGEKLYGGVCAGCHGPAAEGAYGPKLSDYSEVKLVDLINKYKGTEQSGSGKIMSSIAVGLSDDDVNRVSKYIANMNKK